MGNITAGKTHLKTNRVKNSVADPCHFGMDPDPRIRTDPDVDTRGPKTYGCGYGILLHLHHSSKMKSHK
jgi:hypothetical protein